MIPRLKGVIAYGHNPKLPREDGEDATIGSGTRPSPKAKSFEEDPRDTLTHGWGNIPNPEKNSTLVHSGGNRPIPKKDPAGIKLQGQNNNRLGKAGKVRSTLIPPKAKLTREASR